MPLETFNFRQTLTWSIRTHHYNWVWWRSFLQSGTKAPQLVCIQNNLSLHWYSNISLGRNQLKSVFGLLEEASGGHQTIAVRHYHSRMYCGFVISNCKMLGEIHEQKHWCDFTFFLFFSSFSSPQVRPITMGPSLIQYISFENNRLI